MEVGIGVAKVNINGARQQVVKMQFFVLLFLYTMYSEFTCHVYVCDWLSGSICRRSVLLPKRRGKLFVRSS